MQEKLNKNVALFILCVSSFLVPFMGASLNLALPLMGKAFSMNAIVLSWVSTSYLIITAIFQVPFARMADLLGRRKIFIAGLLLSSSANFLCGLAPSVFCIFLTRIFSALGSAMMFGTSMAILTAIFPPQERGKAIGITTSVVYLALASGPFLGGMMTHYWGWQSIFLIVGTVGFIFGIYSLFFFKNEWVESQGESFDYIGSSIFAIGLFGLIFGFSRLPQIDSFLYISAGIVAFFLFVFYELKCQQPVFNVRIFSNNKAFGLASISALINYAATSAVAFIISWYLQYVRGFDVQHAGFILITQAIVQSAVSLYAGKLSDKFNPSLFATLGMGISVVGLFGLIFLSSSSSIVFLIFLLILLGLGFGLFSSPNSMVIMSSVEKKYYGQASATMGTMRLTGQAFSMGIAMMALSLFVGTKEITPELRPNFMKSLHVVFIICTILCVIGTYTSSFRLKKTDKTI